jgi:nitrite reductase/ring-hydroxylating ferredoxin subunit
LDGGTNIAPAEGDELVCVTHGARYRSEDGHCVSGPCLGQSLKKLPIEVGEGIVFALVAEDGSPLDPD